MRKKKLARNTISALTYQGTAIICGFVLPRLILQHFGSSVNGLTSSITQFLQIIAFLDLGVGAVVQSALYRPLAEGNKIEISTIFRSATRFFQRIAEILVIYVVILIVAYPHLVSNKFDWGFTATLIAAMAISSFAQYYFGVVNRLLLLADQRGYVQYDAQTITLVLNTIACSILIVFGGSIQLVKLTTSLIFLLRPIALRLYVDHNYDIDRRISYSGEPIKQKWNGLAQHISAVVLDGTDTIVLTVFSTMNNVSIYSVYNLVTYGVTQLFLSISGGIQALMGELWARQEIDNLRYFFGKLEWIIHSATVYVFGCTFVLIVPFVQIYTKGVTDANYVQPFFAALMILASAAHCLRTPYALMILAAGHYKQTQSSFIVATTINVVFSILLVFKFGLIGVAAGTVLAMAYQIVWMAVYLSNHLIHWKITSFVRQIFVDAVTILIATPITSIIRLSSLTYGAWIAAAIQVVAAWGLIEGVINLIFYRDRLTEVFKRK